MKKQLTYLALAGLVATPVAFAADYTQSVNGSVRVTWSQVGGDDNASNNYNTTTLGAGDTYLKWGHNLSNDDGSVANGYITFRSNGNWDYGFTASGTSGDWLGEAAAEWDQTNVTGATTYHTVTPDAQYVRATHSNGFSIYLGYDEHIGTNKGWANDLTTGGIKDWADAGANGYSNGDFNAFKLGYNSADLGLSLGLGAQIDGAAESTSAKLFGGGSYGAATSNNGRSDVRGNFVELGYNNFNIDTKIQLLNGSVKARDVGVLGTEKLTAASVGFAYYIDLGTDLSITPFINYYNGDYEYDGQKTEDKRAYNLGVDFVFGNHSVTAALGRANVDSNLSVNDVDNNGVALNYTTSLGLVGLKAGYSSAKTEQGTSNATKTQLSFRLQYDF